MKLSRIILKSKCTVSERKAFLEKERKYLAHLHKELKPATYQRFRVSREITFTFGFHAVSELNILYFKWLPAVRKSHSLISKIKNMSTTRAD